MIALWSVCLRVKWAVLVFWEIWFKYVHLIRLRVYIYVSFYHSLSQMQVWQRFLLSLPTWTGYIWVVLETMDYPQLFTNLRCRLPVGATDWSVNNPWNENWSLCSLAELYKALRVGKEFARKKIVLKSLDLLNLLLNFSLKVRFSPCLYTFRIFV